MNVNSKTPMALYKANLELVLRIGAMLQENRQRWMQAGVAGTSDAIRRTLAETERMLTTNDWTSLSTLPGDEFWKSLQAGTGPLQGTVESAVRSQTEFAEGLKQAFAEWQQQTAEALGEPFAQSANLTFADLMKGFATAAPPPHAEPRPSKPRPAESAASAKPSVTAKAKPAAKPQTAKKSASKKSASTKRKPARR